MLRNIIRINGKNYQKKKRNFNEISFELTIFIFSLSCVILLYIKIYRRYFIMDTISTENLSEIMTNATTYAILTHKRPDGDAISSALSMFWYLIDIGK